MSGKLREKTMEALSAVLPITGVVLLLSTVLAPLPVSTVVMFLTGAGLLVAGMGLFSLGTDIAMMPMGESLGASLTGIRRLKLLLGLAFALGLIITVAEPDLDVLARQVAAIPNTVLIYTVAAGVGLFLAAALLRIVFQIPLSRLLILFYTGILLLSLRVPADFLAVAFDSGGVTTGPITVPFLLALGAGLNATRSDKASHDDSFGLVALCSVGPIAAVMLLGILYRPGESVYAAVTAPPIATMQDVARQFAWELPFFAREVLLALAPVCAFFLAYQIATRRFGGRALGKIGVGILYTFAGLVLFLTGVNVGFIPMGNLLGSAIAGSGHKWLLLPLGVLIGYFIVAAEPAVHVLNRQVETVSGGAISAGAMRICLSAGVAVSVGLSMLRVLTGLSIYWILLPGYGLALLLSRFVPPMFTCIAFDSGGVASGPMTTTFLLPFAMGACEALGGNTLTDAFGAVAAVAMTPLIAIQLMGLLNRKKLTGHADTDVRAVAA